MLAYISYMDPMGKEMHKESRGLRGREFLLLLSVQKLLRWMGLVFEHLKLGGTNFPPHHHGTRMFVDFKLNRLGEHWDFGNSK